MQPTLHRWWYCHQKFRVSGKEYEYLEATHEFVDGVLESVIKFTDGIKRHTMTEEEFYEKVKTSFKLPVGK